MVQTELVATLDAALVAAFVGGFVAVRLGLPTLVGYLVAGVVIGPYTPRGARTSTLPRNLPRSA